MSEPIVIADGSEQLREALKELRDEWLNRSEGYALESLRALDSGRAMAQDARASMCQDHAARLDALLAAVEPTEAGT